MNAERYKVMLETFLCIELTSSSENVLWLQQDGATAHTAEISMQVLMAILPCRHISRYRTTPGPPPGLAWPRSTTLLPLGLR